MRKRMDILIELVSLVAPFPYWLSVPPVKSSTNGSRWGHQLLFVLIRTHPGIDHRVVVPRLKICQATYVHWGWKVGLVTRPRNAVLVQPVAEWTVDGASCVWPHRRS